MWLKACYVWYEIINYHHASHFLECIEEWNSHVYQQWTLVFDCTLELTKVHWTPLGCEISNSVTDLKVINHLFAHFSNGNRNKYLNSRSFLHIGMAHAVEVLPQVRHELTYSAKYVSCVLMLWRRKEPGHQQPWYQQCWTGLICLRVDLFSSECDMKYILRRMHTLIFIRNTVSSRKVRPNYHRACSMWAILCLNCKWPYINVTWHSCQNRSHSILSSLRVIFTSWNPSNFA